MGRSSKDILFDVINELEAFGLDYRIYKKETSRECFYMIRLDGRKEFYIMIYESGVRCSHFGKCFTDAERVCIRRILKQYNDLVVEI